MHRRLLAVLALAVAFAAVAEQPGSAQQGQLPLPGFKPPPPAPINYFGYNEQPVWDQGYNQWGFWFFGIWIPLPF